MRLVVNNPNNLEIKDINVVTSKVRAIINYNLNIFIVNYNNILMFPGGKIREEEVVIDALKREVIEELGIEVQDETIIPFIRFDNYLYNYPSRKGIIYNKLVNNYYYVINVKSDYNKNISFLSDKEKNSSFEVLKVDLKNLDEFISNHNSSNEANPFYKDELIKVLKEFKCDFDIDFISNAIYKKCK